VQDGGAVVPVALPPAGIVTALAPDLPRVIGRDATAPQDSEPQEPQEPVPANLAAAVQTELARLGCYRARVDGLWGPQSSRALMRFLVEKDLPADSLDPTETVWRAARAQETVICEAPPPVVAARATPSRPAAAPQPTAPRQAAPVRTPSRTAPAPQSAAPQINNRLRTGVFR
jgi:hypothetical protein